MSDQQTPTPLTTVVWMGGHGPQPKGNGGRQILVLLGHKGPYGHNLIVGEYPEMQYRGVIIDCHSTFPSW